MKMIMFIYVIVFFVFAHPVFAVIQPKVITIKPNHLDNVALQKLSSQSHRTHIILTDKDACVMGDYNGVRFHPIYLSSSSIEDFKIKQIITLMHFLHGNIILCSNSPNGIPNFCKSLYDVVFMDVSRENAIRNILVTLPNNKKLSRYIKECDIDDLRNKVLEQGKYKRPAKWAKKIKVHEFDNLYKVSYILYRGEQPDKAGLKKLSKIGIGSIIPLRGHNIDPEIGKGSKLNYYHIPISLTLNKDGSCLEIDHAIVKALRIIKSSKKPVFIHCFHGSDRTGLVTAAYRIILQGWTKKAAVNEMKNGGFEFHFVKYFDYIKQMDIKKMHDEVFKKRQIDRE